MSNDINDSIASVEARLKLKQERLQALRHKDAFFSQRFQQNMQALADIMPHIHESFQAYTPKNQEIFLDESGDLNIELAPNKPLYQGAVKSSANAKIKQVIKNPNKTVLDITRSEDHPSRHVFYNNLIQDIIDKGAEGLTPLTEIPDYAGSVFFFGIELGYQLEAFLSLKEVKHLYLYEADSDLFYYSLFAIDWLPILEAFNQDGKTIHIIIGLSPKELSQKYALQLSENGHFMAGMTYLHVAYISPDIQAALDYFIKHYSTQIMGWGFFDDALMGLAHGLKSLPKSKLARITRGESGAPKSLANWMKDIPVFILGNGPSLDNSIALIKEVQDKALFICCGTTINTLSRLGIKPDMHVDVERMIHTAQKFEFLDASYLEDIFALSVDVMHPDFFKYFKRSGMGMKPGEAITSLILSKARAAGDMTEYVQMNHSGPIVANLALSFVHLFGFKNVYFAGVDNGFKDATSHHSKHSGYYGKDGKETGFQTFGQEKLIARAGNFGGEVYTTSIMESSRVQLELMIKQLHQERTFSCFNLSDGAKIEGSIPVQPDDALILDPDINKQKVMDALYETFFDQAPEDILKTDTSELISKTTFDELVVFLMKGWDQSVQTREDVCRLFWVQYRTLFLLKTTVHSHLYDIFAGSFTYTAFAIVKTIYAYQEEKEAVEYAKSIFDIWCDFLQEMPSMADDVSQFVDGGSDKMRLLYNG